MGGQRLNSQAGAAFAPVRWNDGLVVGLLRRKEFAMVEVINSLSTLSWPGACAVAALSAGAVGLAFAFVKWMKD